MTLSRRKMIALIGGGAILAATAPLAAVATRRPRTATRPWMLAGHETEVRRRALSWALLAPNPHNRQPWLVDLGTEGEVLLYADPARMLPVTDPLNRQITIGLGGFLELMRMAASHDGHRVTITPFPEGEDAARLDARPVARAVFAADPGVVPDPLFAHALSRRSVKEPYDTARPVAAEALDAIGTVVTAGSGFGGTVAMAEVEGLRHLTHDALRLEFTTPHTMQESIDLFRIGRNEVDANPDGIDFSGPLFEVMGATGLFTRETAADQTSQSFKAALDMIEGTAMTSMGFVWLVTGENTRSAQLAAGADWLRVNLAITGAGLCVQPMSQALQEFPEMAALYAEVHARLAPQGGTVQMLGRIGYGPEVGPSPRWPLETRIL